MEEDVSIETARGLLKDEFTLGRNTNKERIKGVLLLSSIKCILYIKAALTVNQS